MPVDGGLLSRALEIMEQRPGLFLDYDGTLVPIVMSPDECYPDHELVSLLRRLREKFDLYIVTGRSMEEITGFIGTGYKIIALHGAMSMIHGKVSESPGVKQYSGKCAEIFSLRGAMEERFPGLRMYNKGASVLFHTGLIEDRAISAGLSSEIGRLSRIYGMEAYRGKNVLELRIPGINKGIAIKRFRNGSPAIIAGDDATDEEAFRENPDALRIKVGSGETSADFTVPDYSSFREFLASLGA